MPETCKGCGRSVGVTSGEVTLTAGSDTYHEECFTCAEAGCNANLQLGYMVDDATGKLYCPDHDPAMQETMGTCTRCKQPVFVHEGGMKALNSVWHNSCWTCFGCEEPITGNFFPSDDAQPVPYCEDCYSLNHGAMCAVCHKIGKDVNKVTTIKKTQITLCNKCWKCKQCNKSLIKQKFFHGSTEHEFFCEQHKDSGGRATTAEPSYSTFNDTAAAPPRARQQQQQQQPAPNRGRKPPANTNSNAGGRAKGGGGRRAADTPGYAVLAPDVSEQRRREAEEMYKASTQRLQQAPAIPAKGAVVYQSVADLDFDDEQPTASRRASVMALQQRGGVSQRLSAMNATAAPEPTYATMQRTGNTSRGNVAPEPTYATAQVAAGGGDGLYADIPAPEGAYAEANQFYPGESAGGGGGGGGDEGEQQLLEYLKSALKVTDPAGVLDGLKNDCGITDLDGLAGLTAAEKAEAADELKASGVKLGDRGKIRKSTASGIEAFKKKLSWS